MAVEAVLAAVACMAVSPGTLAAGMLAVDNPSGACILACALVPDSLAVSIIPRIRASRTVLSCTMDFTTISFIPSGSAITVLASAAEDGAVGAVGIHGGAGTMIRSGRRGKTKIAASTRIITAST